MTQPCVEDKLANIETHAVVREVAVLRRNREVRRLLEHNEVVRVRNIAYRRGWLQVRHWRVGDDERC